MLNFSGRNIFFVSDTHFSHKQPFVWQKRGFPSIEAHNETILQSINDTVGDNDVLFHLGDFCLNTTIDEFELLISKIRCQNVYLQMGNHANPHYKQAYKPVVQRLLGNAYTSESEVFPLRYKNIIYINHYIEITVNGQFIVLSHFPHLVWNHSGKGSWMLCGHSHSDCPMTNSGGSYGKILDVSYDEHRKPLSFDEIKCVMDTKTILSVDHH